jgi:hypothetical protein
MNSMRLVGQLIMGGTQYLALSSIAIQAAQDGSPKEHESNTNKVEVTDAARPATDVRITEHAGVTVQESGSSIDEDTRLKSTRRQYDFGTGLTSFGIVSLTSNTDGRAGNEIPVYMSSNTGPRIRIIDDARRTTRQYDFGIGLSYFEITRLTDTNGQGGVEIVTRLDSGSYSRAIRIIDDSNQR